VQDVRYALGTLRKSPGFTTVAVLTLALGIGANTAIFSVVNAVILQPLGYPQPEQLQFLTTRFGRGESGQSSVSPAEYWELTEINHSFSVVGAFATGEVNLAARDRPRRVTRATVNAELLEALAVQPEHGRWIRREETRAGGRRGIRAITARGVRRGASGSHVLDVRSAGAGLSAFDRSIPRHAGRR
ncbi:MAG: ABC transporter permease, partial [Burkholderiales bacterium]